MAAACAEAEARRAVNPCLYENAEQVCCDECAGTGADICVTVGAGEFTSEDGIEEANSLAMANACAQAATLRLDVPCGEVHGISISRECRYKSGAGEAEGAEDFTGENPGKRYKTRTVIGSMDVTEFFESQTCDTDSCTAEVSETFSHATHPDGGPTYSGSWALIEMSRTLTTVTYQCQFAIARDDTGNMSGVFAYWLSVDGAHLSNGSIVTKNINGFTFGVVVSVTWASAQAVGPSGCVQPGRWPAFSDTWDVEQSWNFGTSDFDTVTFDTLRETSAGGSSSPIPAVLVTTVPENFYIPKISIGFGIPLQPTYVSTITTPTTRTTTGLGCVPFPPPDGGGGICLSLNASGTVTETLSDEDIPTNVVDRVVDTIEDWTNISCDELVTSVEEDEEAAVSFTVGQIQITAGETGSLVIDTDYEITVTFGRRILGSSDEFVALVETLVIVFTATELTHVTDWIDVPFADGFETKVLSVEIVESPP